MIRPSPLRAVGCAVAAAATCATLAVAGGASAATAVTLSVGGAPLSGATVPARTTIDLPDPSAVAVSWVLDGVYVGRDTTRPFQLAIATTPGEHKVKARAVTTSRTTTTHEVRFRTSAASGASTSPTPSASPRPTASPTASPTATASPRPTVSPTASTPTPAIGAVRTVRTAGELAAALSSAAPGQVVQLADGVYHGRFAIRSSGTASAPITLRGTRAAVLDGGATSTGYALHLDGAGWWRLEGFTVRGAQKGVVLDRSSRNVLTGLDVGGSGMEAVHFRTASSDNQLLSSLVHDTGRYEPGYGEGVYVGSAVSNWAKYGGGGPDRSDRNVVSGNRIWATTAENVDVKEGTTGGVVSGNAFDGSGITGAHFGDSWIDLKGNGYAIRGNRGVRSPRDGFQTHVQLAGWGRGNTFSGNVLQVDGPGYGIHVDEPSTSANQVACDNVVLGAASGLSNQACR